LDTTTVPNGTYTLQAIADATRGPNGFSSPLPITVNNPPPTTNVVLLVNGATESGQFYLDAIASPRTASVNFVFSRSPDNWSPRVLNGTIATIYGWLSDLNTAAVPGGMPNGTYTVQSRACTIAFVCGTSAGVSFTVSN
jgi:hypothetical protein